MSEYKLVTSRTAAGLQAAVLKKIEQGWKPFGMPVSRDDSLTQAMVPGGFPSGGYMVVSAEVSGALQELVQQYVAKGWKMLGVPVAREANISQALISADADTSDSSNDSADDDSTTTSDDTASSTTVYSGGLLSYSPDIDTVEYNGRRGDGLPVSQGWTESSGTFSVSANDDGLGGYVLVAEKEDGYPWELERYSSGGADMLIYGGEVVFRFRITDASATDGKYAFGVYWLIDSDDVPDGVTFSRTGDSATPSLLNLFVQTDSTNMYLYMYCNKANSTELSNIKLATIGEFDNEWHEIRIVYKGGTTARATLYVDSSSVGDFTQTATPASVSTNTVVITGITKDTTYSTELSLFRARVFRDDGTVTLGSDDVSSAVWFPDDSRGGGVVLPDADISPGNTVKIFSEGSGSITVTPATDDILIIPQGETEGYPSAVTVTGNTRLVQTDTSGRTWRVMGEDGTS